jgi:hypothetical protein
MLDPTIQRIIDPPSQTNVVAHHREALAGFRRRDGPVMEETTVGSGGLCVVVVQADTDVIPGDDARR